MKKVYSVKKGYKGCVVHTSKPLSRESGKFVLEECSQAELKYLHDVVGHSAVEVKEVKSNGRKQKETSED